MTKLCEEQRLVEPVIGQLHVAHAGTLRVIKQVNGIILGLWSQEEPGLQIAYCRSRQSSQQQCPVIPLRIRFVAVLAEIDWMADMRPPEAVKLLLLNAHPIF